jgi:hypothetical protein
VVEISATAGGIALGVSLYRQLLDVSQGEDGKASIAVSLAHPSLLGDACPA